MTSADIKPIERTDDARLSVDLGRKLWCRHKDGACAKGLPIEAADGDGLKLSNAGGPQGDNRIEVDVSSGAYSALIRVRPGVMPEIISTAKGALHHRAVLAGDAVRSVGGSRFRSQ